VDSLFLLPGTGDGQVEAEAETETGVDYMRFGYLARKKATDQIAWEREWEEIQQKASSSLVIITDVETGCRPYRDAALYTYPAIQLGLPAAGTYPEFQKK
jgi:hypothetical protein